MRCNSLDCYLFVYYERCQIGNYLCSYHLYSCLKIDQHGMPLKGTVNTNSYRAYVRTHIYTRSISRSHSPARSLSLSLFPTNKFQCKNISIKLTNKNNKNRKKRIATYMHTVRVRAHIHTLSPVPILIQKIHEKKKHKTKP